MYLTKGFFLFVDLCKDNLTMFPLWGYSSD